MPTSRGLRPISFWVNETEKPRAPLGDGTEIHGGVLLFVFRSLFYPAPCWQTFCWNQRLQAPPAPLCTRQAPHTEVRVSASIWHALQRGFHGHLLRGLRLLLLIHEYPAPSFFLSKLRHKCTQTRVSFVFVHCLIFGH